jgi:hypothetical protein
MGKLLQTFCIFCILALLILFIWLTGGPKTPSQKEMTEKALRKENTVHEVKDSGSGYINREKSSVKTSPNKLFSIW